MANELRPVNTIAPLRNVAAFAELVDRVVNRTPGLPGMATFHGFSGYGKTFAAIYAANKHRAYHVQVKSVWTRKKLCQSILAEMGVQPAATIPDMMDQIGQQLSLSRRPLIIDEADFLVAKGMIEVVRDIYESSQAAIILVGEEGLPSMLKRWERVHGRMLDWVPAQPASLGDARHLAQLYCRGIEVADDLLAPLHDASGGSVRRICVNLDRVREHAETGGLARIGRAEFQIEFFTGNAPASRRAA
ncbi:MAG TPA: ATP-binding protein [Aliidongia sp.]|nr:ATP-binding protein [Aliidongia sp.]